MTPDQPSTVPAGWYPDPHGIAELRWWDGSTWTENVHSSAPPQAEPRDQAQESAGQTIDASGTAVYDLDYIPENTQAAELPAETAQPEVVPTDAAAPSGVSAESTPPVVEQPESWAPPAEPTAAVLPGATDSESPAAADDSLAEPAPSDNSTPLAVPAPLAPSASPGVADPVAAPASREQLANDAPLPSRRELRERERLSGTAAAATAGAVAQHPPAAQADSPAEPPAESPAWPPPGVAEAAPTAVPVAAVAPAAAAPAPAGAEPAVLDSATPSSFDWSPGSPSTNSVPAAEPLPAGSAWASEGTDAGAFTDTGAFVDDQPVPDRSGTASGWIIAFMPLIATVLSIGAVKGAENYPQYLPDGIQWWMLTGGMLAILYLVTLLLAIADHRRLDSLGHLYPAHWAWSLLTAPVYLLVRTIAVRRETGRMSPLLWVWILLTALLVGAWFATQALAPELLAAYELPFL